MTVFLYLLVDLVHDLYLCVDVINFCGFKDRSQVGMTVCVFQ